MEHYPLSNEQIECLRYFYEANQSVSIYSFPDNMVKHINSNCINELEKLGYIKIAHYLNGDKERTPDEYQITFQGKSYIEQLDKKQTHNVFSAICHFFKWLFSLIVSIIPLKK